jgi:hypothetical protein
MLRIVTEQHGDIFTISLHGRMAGDWVALLDRYWRSIVDSVPAAKITAVLSDVSFIDTEGERLLERMSQHGVEFVASGCMNRHVIDTIRERTAPGKAERLTRH